jgi:tripartite-type tricarboxylate transporter receptor subunit TctC
MELFKSMTGTNIVHVPYKGIALAMPDLFAGRVSAAITNLPGAVDPIKAGRVRALGVTTLKRQPVFPDLPTISEAGVPGYEVTVWYGMCAPKGSPNAVVRKINADFAHLVSTTDLRQRLELQGVEPDPGSPERFAEFIRIETAKWAKVVKEAGIEARF